VAFIETIGVPKDIAITMDGNRAFIACSIYGVKLIDLSNK
jgi:hypothetical protein